MIILPYSSTLELAQKPIVTYVMAGLWCIVVFYLQLTTNITESITYWSDLRNPITMITSLLAHGGFGHIIGNLIFFMAFVLALEIPIGSTWRYLTCMLSTIVTESCIQYFFLGADPPHASLGFSGVVAGMMGLSAYPMPRRPHQGVFLVLVRLENLAAQSWW